MVISKLDAFLEVTLFNADATYRVCALYVYSSRITSGLNVYSAGFLSDGEIIVYGNVLKLGGLGACSPRKKKISDS